MRMKKVEAWTIVMGYFLGYEKYSIDVFYNKKYQRWLFDNSTDANKNIHPEFDINGFIINVKFTAFHNSIPLTENDFIDIQTDRLNTFLELKDLKSMDKIQIQHFKRYLINRSKTINSEILIIKPNELPIGDFTNDTYYTILEKCTIEAFECLKLKDHYPTDGSKAIWDISSLTITNGNGLPTERDNELFTKGYIKENMRVAFLLAIERYITDFQKNYSISRSVFYKKCYQSLLLKVSESPLWEKPDFGIDINNPCMLTFIWNMRNDIEARSTETKRPEAEPLDLSDASTVKRNKPNKLKKGLDEFFYNIIDKEKFLKELKATFTTERGKNFKIIISLLIEANVLIINSREFKDFHSELVTFFDRNIGTRQSINDVIFNDIPKPIIEPIEKKLNPLIIKYKTK
jgi:hypothetical protein